jgi:hypothetical protein
MVLLPVKMTIPFVPFRRALCRRLPLKLAPRRLIGRSASLLAAAVLLGVPVLIIAGPANAESVDSITVSTHGPGATNIELIGAAPVGQEVAYAEIVVKTGNVTDLTQKLAFEAAKQDYQSLTYEWSCADGGEHTVTVTFPDGTVVTHPIAIPEQPCQHRWRITPVRLHLGEQPVLSVRDTWKFRWEKIRLCWTTLRLRAKCSNITQSPSRSSCRRR